MAEMKNFVLNCDVCDARKMKEEDWTSYQQIIINTDIMVVDERSKSILNKLPIVTNMDETIETTEEIHLISHNGQYEITGQSSFPPNTFLCINGSLRIHPGTEEVLKSLYKTCVNGSVICPESLVPYLSKLSVNGSTTCYPDDCILMPAVFSIDKYFPIRAKEKETYYVKDEVLFTDAGIDILSLAKKQAHFITNSLVVAEEYLDSALPMFDENVEVKVVPRDFAFVHGDAELNKALLTQYGPKLYISGSLILKGDSHELLSEIEALHVYGNINLYEDQLEELKKVHAEYRQLNLMKRIKAKILEGKGMATLDQALLDASPDGILYRSCGTLQIKEGVSPAQLLEKVQLENCGYVRCSPEQKTAVEAISQNTGYIDDGQGEAGMAINGILANMTNSKVVNTDYHIL